MANNNEMKSQTKEMFEKVEGKIQELASMRHNQLVSMLDEVKEKRQALNQRIELSALGKSQEHEKISQEVTARLENLNLEFEEKAANVPKEIDVIVQYQEAEKEEEPAFTPTMAEAVMLDNFETLNKNFSELLAMQKQNLLLEELRQYDAEEFVRFAEDAHRIKDDTVHAVLDRFGRRLLTQKGNPEAVARFGRLLERWGEEIIPEHRKRAAQIKVRIGGIQADWRFFFNQVKQQIL